MDDQEPTMPVRMICLIALVGCGSESQLAGPEPQPEAPAPAPTSPPVLQLPGEEPVEQDPQCTTTYACPRADPAWDAVVEWEEVVEPQDANWWFTMPVVAELDGDEVPEIVVGSSRNDWSSSWNTYLSVWGGDGAGLLASFPEMPLTLAPTAVSVGDVDGDGQPEMVVSVMDDPLEPDEEVRRVGPHRLAAVRLDGTVLWTSEPYVVTLKESDDEFYVNRLAPVIADLEGDGAVEVFADGLLFDGATGALLAAQPPLDEVWWGTTTVADLDLDGASEIVHVGRVLDAQANLLWEFVPYGNSAYPAVVQLDDDAQGEVVFATPNGLHAFDTDGAPLWDRQIRQGEQRGTESLTSPCVADFDGDGELEIFGVFGTDAVLFERDGTVAWSLPGHERSMSCAGFDLDLDGRSEIALAGDGLRLLCGADGKTLYHDTTRPHAGAQSYPVVVDLDGDDSAEIVVATADITTEMDPESDAYWQTDGTSGLLVYGHPDGLWPETGSVWPQYDHRPDPQLVHVDPAQGEPGPIDPPEVVTSPDLALRLADQLGDCSGLSLSVQTENHGTQDVGAGRLLQIEAVESAALGVYQTTPVRTLTLPALPAGVRQAAVRVDLGPEELGAWGVRLSIPVDPDQPECDPDDQELIISFPCP
jgi:hypothetical protein